MRELVDSGRYDTHDNFTVVLQPFMREVYLPRLEVREANYLMHICCFFFFHLHLRQSVTQMYVLFKNERMAAPIARTSRPTVSISARELTLSWLALFGTTW